MMSEGNNMPVEVKEKKDLKDICENDVTLSGSTREVRSYYSFDKKHYT